ncbi:MAG: hypothetical protein ACYDEN_03600 [Acidimicrobiales bacterium]
MTGAARLGAALAGDGVVAFAPLAWGQLPQFVRVPAGDRFWNDPDLTCRMLTDAAGLCGADAVVVPLLPGSDPQGPVDATAVVDLPAVAAASAVIESLAGSDELGVLAELPDAAGLRRLIAGGDDLDVEDAASSLARAAFEAGAAGVAVRSPDEVQPVFAAAAALADFYGGLAVGVGGGWCRGHPDSLPVAAVGSDGAWPVLERGVVVTAGDLTEWWSAAELAALWPGTRRPR